MKKTLIQSSSVKKVICAMLVLFAVSSCNKRIEKKLEDSNWRSFERTIEYDTETVTEDESQFVHYLEFKKDGTFYRTYESGTWELEGKQLFVTAFEADCEHVYKIIKCTEKELVLESERGVGETFVGCGFGGDSDPIITETYKRIE